MIGKSAFRLAGWDQEYRQVQNYAATSLLEYCPVHWDLATTVDLTEAGRNVVPATITGFTAVLAGRFGGVTLCSADTALAAVANHNHFVGILQHALDGIPTNGDPPHIRKQIGLCVTAGQTRCRVNGALDVGDLLQPSPGNSYLVKFTGTQPAVAQVMQANTSGTSVRDVLLLNAAPFGGQTQRIIAANWAWNSTTPLLIGYIPEGASVLRTELIVDVAVIGNTWTMDIGDSGDPNRILDFAGDVAASPGIGTYGVTRSGADLVPFEATAPTRVIGTITVGNGSAGSGRVFLHVAI